MTFGDNLQSLREQHNIKSLTLFKKLTGISRTHVRRLERGDSYPTENILDAIIFGLCLSDGEIEQLRTAAATDRANKEYSRFSAAKMGTA